MAEMKFAFILTGGNNHPVPEFLMFENENNNTKICGVKDIEAAIPVAQQLVEEGYNLIELCGAFQEEGYKKIKEVIGDKAKLGYIIHP